MQGQLQKLQGKAEEMGTTSVSVSAPKVLARPTRTASPFPPHPAKGGQQTGDGEGGKCRSWASPAPSLKAHLRRCIPAPPNALTPSPKRCSCTITAAFSLLPCVAAESPGLHVVMCCKTCWHHPGGEKNGFGAVT